MICEIVDKDHIRLGGEVIALPDIAVNQNIHVATAVALDGLPLDVVTALRVLVAQRAWLQQQVADLQEALHAAQRPQPPAAP